MARRLTQRRKILLSQAPGLRILLLSLLRWALEGSRANQAKKMEGEMETGMISRIITRIKRSQIPCPDLNMILVCHSRSLAFTSAHKAHSSRCTVLPRRGGCRLGLMLKVPIYGGWGKLYMGGCQNYDPFLGTLNIRCRIRLGIQKGTVVLTTTHLLYHKS